MNKSKAGAGFEDDPFSEDGGSLKGVRAQTMNVLNKLVKGRLAQASHAIPFDMEEHQRSYLFNTMKSQNFWKNADARKIRGEHLEGTLHHEVIFKVLVKQGWVEPTPAEHWVPNMRYYAINHEGEKARAKGLAWWNSLTLPRKIWANVVE